MQTPLEILNTIYGYDSFRPMQESVINQILSHKDSLVLMPTGGGKSICYQIPALIFDGLTVVVSPLISLMKDQVDALKSNGVAAAAINSNNSETENDTIKTNCQEGKIKILYISPERLQKELQWMQCNIKISLFAIDEAHCISQWGHDFRPEYTQLSNLHNLFPKATIAAFTATADSLTQEDIINQLKLIDCKVFKSTFDRPNLSLDVKVGYSEKEKIAEIVSIIKRHNNDSGIIYCLSRKNTEKVAELLKNQGINAVAYHAGMTTEVRNKVQDDFSNDRINVICATIAFGMGIDKSNVRFIIHFNLPKSIENFYQEIGRGGRDGLPCETVLFYNIQDIITLRKFIEDSGQKEINREKLNRMQEYAEAQVCRRRILLNYFGENNACNCGNCDVCNNPPTLFDGTVIVQKALSAIKRTDENVGFTLTIDILKGTQSPDVLKNGYEKLKTFGVGADLTAKKWYDYLLQMLQLGYIQIAYDENNHLKINASGYDILFGKNTAQLAVPIKKDYKVSENQKDTTPGTYSDIDKNLFEILRNLRKDIASENNWPAYVVLPDKTLYELAKNKPVTIEDFGNTYGIGQRKKEQFGLRFVKTIADYLHVDYQEEQSENPFAEFVKEEKTSYMERQKQLHSQAYQPWTEDDDKKLLKLFNHGFTVAELADFFERGRGAITSRLKKLTFSTNKTLCAPSFS
ncbi:MAG: DNA helicase RecQ [Bacteroidales bacterium]|nr:DNA helicase RecQ [Bacteroidales bacterium]